MPKRSTRKEKARTIFTEQESVRVYVSAEGYPTGVSFTGVAWGVETGVA